MKVIDPYPPTTPPGQDDLPCSDGEPMETPRHRRQMILLIESLVYAWTGRDDVFVGGDMFVYYSMLQAKRNDFRGPDVFVVLGAIPERERKRKSWVVWEERGKLPDVVIELTSPSTAHVDRGEKKRIYERVWHLPEYFIFDPWEKTLEGWSLVGSKYQALGPLPNGDLPSRALGLHLGLRDGEFHDDRTDWLRWIDPATDLVLPSGPELGREGRAMAEAAREHADALSQRADAEQRRADIEKERADAEQRRADIEKERADAEQRRADSERERADALAMEIAAMKKRLGDLG